MNKIFIAVGLCVAGLFLLEKDVSEKTEEIKRLKNENDKNVLKISALEKSKVPSPDQQAQAAATAAAPGPDATAAGPGKGT